MKVLIAELAPTCDAVLRLANIREAASTTTDIAMLARWIAKNQCMWRDIACHDGPCTYKRKLPNGYTANDDCSSPNGCSILYKCWRNFPVICAFQLPVGVIARGARSLVKHTCGPTKTPSSNVTPSKIEA